MGRPSDRSRSSDGQCRPCQDRALGSADSSNADSILYYREAPWYLSTQAHDAAPALVVTGLCLIGLLALLTRRRRGKTRRGRWLEITLEVCTLLAAAVAAYSWFVGFAYGVRYDTSSAHNERVAAAFTDTFGAPVRSIASESSEGARRSRLTTTIGGQAAECWVNDLTKLNTGTDLPGFPQPEAIAWAGQHDAVAGIATCHALPVEVTDPKHVPIAAVKDARQALLDRP